jgi:hypothetical protein
MVSTARRVSCTSPGRSKPCSKDAIRGIIEPYGGPIRPKLHCSCPPGDDAQALQVVAARHLAPRLQGEMVPVFSAMRRVVAERLSRESSRRSELLSLYGRPIEAALSEPGTVTSVGCRCRTGRPRKDEKEDSMRSRLLTGTKETAQAFRRWCERAENICIVTAWANDCMACECREKVRSKISTMAVAWISARPRLFPRIVPVSHVVSNI